MLFGRVKGSAICTLKYPGTEGLKLLVVQPLNKKLEPLGALQVAADVVDAGIGDLVLTAAGSSARQTNITKDTPVDSVIMSIIDSLEVDGQVVFRKS